MATPAQKATDDELLALDRQLCFKLYAASRAVTKLYRPLLDELCLTYPQYLVLLVLWEWDHRAPPPGPTVKALGERLMLDSGTLTPLLKRLEAQGLISRRRSPRDERAVTLALTDAGRALRKRARAVPERLLCATSLPLADLARLRDDIGRLLGALATE